MQSMVESKIVDQQWKWSIMITMIWSSWQWWWSQWSWQCWSQWSWQCWSQWCCHSPSFRTKRSISTDDVRVWFSITDVFTCLLVSDDYLFVFNNCLFMSNNSLFVSKDCYLNRKCCLLVSPSFDAICFCKNPIWQCWLWKGQFFKREKSAWSNIQMNLQLTHKLYLFWVQFSRSLRL